MNIDRRVLVRRHNPVNTRLEATSPLTVGNGEFAFTADITGLQSFPDQYLTGIPLCTQAQWGWHTTPMSAGLDPRDFRLKTYEVNGRLVGYKTSADGQEELYRYLRENPHRLHLGRIGLRMFMVNGRRAAADNLQDVHQSLDLWTGQLTSTFTLEATPVYVITVCHPVLDLLAVSITSPLVAAGRLQVTLAFPYGSPEIHAAEWNAPDRHRTVVVHETATAIRLLRVLDEDHYFCDLQLSGRHQITKEGHHELAIIPQGGTETLEFRCLFSPRRPREELLPSYAETASASAKHWKQFWNNGGAIDLADSRDTRAHELERRIVLSQYLTAVQCAGTYPPQETGLTCNSWYGKFHLEMHWWHAGHFLLWGRAPLLERSLWWYQAILDKAKELARSQGYRGARWPKMVGPEGEDSPSQHGSLHIWQQPSPILYAELLYKLRPRQSTLDTYREIVMESAEFMASFVEYETTRDRYVLVAPICPLHEIFSAEDVLNPAAEIGYWVHGLTIAQRWRERLGLSRKSVWDRVITKMAALPVYDGVYIGHEKAPDTFTAYNTNHPAMLLNYGMLPGWGVDKETMRRTLHKVWNEWRWENAWGWDFPVVAMTAARLGEPELAVNSLLIDTPKNTYLANGHNWQASHLPVYLPGNGALLLAVAMMAAGWDGGPGGDSPGFPRGTWRVKTEGIIPLL